MANITRTFIDKTNTIISDNKINLGLNPILELTYGNNFSRGLIYFDIKNLKQMWIDKTYPDLTKLHHRLKMQNVAHLSTPYRNKYNKYNDAIRAKSFDLNFFLIDRDWDSGGGFDYLTDGYDTINRIYTTEGSNWYNATTTQTWGHNGVLNDIPNNKIATQHFDIGNECIDIDLTKTINSMIKGEIPNYGIGIAFEETLENTNSENLYYIGFYTNNTHTFFKPYIETTYDDVITDDRTNFYLDKPNKLYFYACIGSQMVNLDEIPTCTINNTPVSVKQATKGVYYINILMDSESYDAETMFYDIWSNLKYNGKQLKDQELYFTTKPSQEYFKFGLPYETQQQKYIVPSIHGINHCEKIIQGEIRKVNINTRVAYTSKEEEFVNKLFYSIYVKDGEGEVIIIDWQPIEQAYNENYFIIKTNELVPYTYHIAIKYIYGMEEHIFKDLNEFTILEKKENIQLLN